MLIRKSARKIQEALFEKGLPFEIIELSPSTQTPQEVATYIGCETGQIIKSLLFFTEEKKEPILILTSSVNCVNKKTIELFIGESISKADARFTREITGFGIGGVPPIGHKEKITSIFISYSLKYSGRQPEHVMLFFLYMLTI
jgi:prolyl-tRNA editing enzyme YbaK/EbsC (Cys-tRNA(Pro) deacylase)